MPRHPTLLRSLPFTLALVLWTTPAPSQINEGAITGRAVDANNGILQGAQVELQPKGVSAVTDAHGNFTFGSLAPGEYRLTVTFVGLNSFEKNVTVTAGQATRVEAALQIAAQNDSIIVTAERPHGEAEAINRQRTAENILQVLPHDVIVSLPNANVADAIGRLPSVTLERDEGEGKYVQIRGTEPRFSNVTIDGVNVLPGKRCAPDQTGHHPLGSGRVR